MNVNDLTFTSLETITVFDYLTGNYKFTLDELQNATLAQAQDVTDLTGKSGHKIGRLKRNKTLTVSGTNGMVSGGLLEMQTGSAFENKATEVLWVDYLAVGAQHKATTSWKAVGTAGAEIDGLFIKNEDGTLGAELTQDSSASAGKFAYAPTTKELSFHTDVAEGTEVVVYYKRKITADVMENDADTFSGKGIVYIDAFAEDKCSNVYRVQIFIPKADFSGEISLELGDNQTVHAFEAEAMAGACGANGYLWTYTVFGVNEADAT